MNVMNYKEVCTHLDRLQMHKIKLGLDAMKDFLHLVGRPERQLQFIHVAGTNGKGSVCATLAESLGNAGLKVGVYTSPHLTSVRERFRVGSSYISEESFARIGQKIIDVLDGGHITYFEFTTAMAFLWFLEENVDLVLLETGLGGRLDATNVVIPLVSVITSISMDHEIYLGHSIEEIAGEKAGIVKPGIPVVAASSGPIVDRIIEKRAKELGSPLYLLGRDFHYELTNDDTWRWYGKLSISEGELSNLHSSRSSLVQQENDSLAIAAFHLLRNHGFSLEDNHIRAGIKNVTWPGRMELISLPEEKCPQDEFLSQKRRYLLDGAHNPAGVKNLAETLAKRFSYDRLIAVWGAMADKDIGSTLQTIAPLVDHFVLTRPEGERSASPERIAQQLPESEKGKAILEANVAKALEVAQSIAGENDLILVAGSLYLLGEIRSLLLGELA